ncbi:acetoacetate--CoA ligase [Proteobacteria bacterium 005FR1]|nr:acetoacetate--CoA ligase [Proteobacteria bacterium 005FR1]
MTSPEAPDLKLWEPNPQQTAESNIGKFARLVGKEQGYPELYDWSVNDMDAFWRAVWEFTAAVGEGEVEPVLVQGETMRDAQWMPNMRLNYAQNLLRERPRNDEAIVFRAENKITACWTYGELVDEVSRLAQALKAQGVSKGDRVAGVMPNMPEAIIAMLAATSLGAIWSSCSPDFGVNGVVDRFGQIEPKVLFVVNGYYYNGKWQDLTETNRELSRHLGSVENLVVLPFGETEGTSADGVRNGILWADFVSACQPRPLEFTLVEFAHPLFIMYSSGTTNKPKCIVHGHGGTLLQHLKEHQLHADIRPGDRLFYFTTCGWMMWNWLVSGLASGATLILYDGSPFYPGGKTLFDYIDAEKITHFGTSAKYIDAVSKSGLEPRKTHSLESVKVILSTGSVLVPESFDFVYRSIKEDVCLSSISGGTDIIGCFAAGNPTLPVYRGELQCRALGMKVEVFDENGKPIVGEKGELVCTAPFPSQPICFWSDENDEKYREAYFEKYPNYWSQGDYVELTERGTMIFYGRSDAVLNPGGVRIGTAEIYRQVESMPEILESLAIGQEWDNDIRIVLFVRLQDGVVLDDALIKAVKTRIRQNASPRHVPAKVIAVTDIPRTKSGKIVELAVKKIVHGEPIKNVEALANPESLAQFKGIPELQR